MPWKKGAGVGQVIESRLQFDDASQSLITRVTLAIDPSRVEIVHQHTESGRGDDPAGVLGARIERLVAHGLRAHLVSANFVTGAKFVSLDLVPEAAPARITQDDGLAELPTTSTTDITAILASAQSVLHHIDSATAGPELGHAIKELDATLSHLDEVSAELEPEIKTLMTSLRQTAQAAQRTLQAADRMLGTGTASGADLPRLIRELTDSARSLRDLADYLERHPESLIRGRKPDQQVDKP